jgi:hypothetical protein
VSRNLRGTLTFSTPKSKHKLISLISMYMLRFIATPKHLELLLPKNYICIIALMPDLQRVFFRGVIEFPYYNSTIRRSGRQAAQKKRPYKTMQGASKRAGRLPKKPKLATDEPGTDEPATDEPATNEPGTEEPATEPPTLEPTDEPAITDPSTMEPRETSREDTHGQGTNEAMARSAVVTTMEVDETAVGVPTITHADGVAILDEYFPKSIDSRPLPPLVRSHAPEDLAAPPSAGPTAVSSEAADVLDPDQGMGGCEMSKSTSNTGSVGSLSSCTDPTSNLSSETDIAALTCQTRSDTILSRDVQFLMIQVSGWNTFYRHSSMYMIIAAYPILLCQAFWTTSPQLTTQIL